MQAPRRSFAGPALAGVDKRMIPVTAYPDQRVGVLGLGRSGLAAARALQAGGAVPVCWDDGESSRADCPFEVADLTRET